MEWENFSACQGRRKFVDIFFGGGQWIGLSQEEQAVGSVKTVCVDNVDNGEENFPGIVIINLFCGEMSKSIVF